MTHIRTTLGRGYCSWRVPVTCPLCDEEAASFCVSSSAVARCKNFDGLLTFFHEDTVQTPISICCGWVKLPFWQTLIEPRFIRDGGAITCGAIHLVAIPELGDSEPEHGDFERAYRVEAVARCLASGEWRISSNSGSGWRISINSGARC